ncbi:DNA helicase [Tanacetum coccineum]
MDCTTPADACGPNVDIETTLVQLSGVPPAEETSVLAPRIQTVAAVDVRNNADRNCVPVSRVFDHFRNMRATSDQAEYMSQTASCSHPLASVDSGNRGSVYTAVMPVSNVPKVASEGLISNNTTKSLKHTDIPYNVVCQASLTTFNHAYLCLDCKDYIIRPALIIFPNTVQETRNRGYGPAKYLRINTNLPYSEGDVLCLTPFTLLELDGTDAFAGEIPASNQALGYEPSVGGGPPQRINKLHQSYMPLQSPLLFVFGQPGFYPELQLKPRDDRGLYDAVSRGDREGIVVGSKIILPRTFTGGPRVFEQKVKDFLTFLKEVKTFGDVSAVLYAIKFQKRGLPHCHTWLWVDSKNEMQDAQQIDNYISAEIPDSVQDPRGYKLVRRLMMHRPCGAASPSAACMQHGSCSKHFPKTYNDRTFFDSNGHTHYRRRDKGVHVMKGESKLDNCDVVPYNHALCLSFEAHINVEYCGWSMLIKYLFKYISKGPDHILAKIRNSDDEKNMLKSVNIKVGEFID